MHHTYRDKIARIVQFYKEMEERKTLPTKLSLYFKIPRHFPNH